MGLLKSGVGLSIAIAGAACYEPELRDCTVACNAESDCAAGQVCGSDKLCAAPEIAGHCSTLPGTAGSGDRDAGVADAMMAVDAAPDAPPDAATHVQLTITIEAKGRVTVNGIGTCDEAPPQNGACTFIVPINQPLTASATPYLTWRFDRWTTAACASVSINTCTFTPSTNTPLGVKFKKD
jgi:hypothetical protein